MLVDFAQDHQRILDRNPYWQSSVAERHAMFGTKPAERKFTTTVPQYTRSDEAHLPPIVRRLAVG
jgi:hypothetical protein